MTLCRRGSVECHSRQRVDGRHVACLDQQPFCAHEKSRHEGTLALCPVQHAYAHTCSPLGESFGKSHLCEAAKETSAPMIFMSYS